MPDSPSSSYTRPEAPSGVPVVGQVTLRGPGSCVRLALRDAPATNVPDPAGAPHVVDTHKYGIDLDCPGIDPGDIRSVSFCVNGSVLGYVSFSTTEGHLKGPVVFDDVHDRYGQPFLLFYDVVYLSFVASFREEEETCELYSELLLCESDEPRDMDNLERMIGTIIELDDPEIRSWMFVDEDTDRKALVRAGRRTRAFRSLPSYVALVESIAACLKANYPYFRTKGRRTIEKSPGLQPYRQVKSVSVSGFQWLMQNTEQLCEIEGPGGLAYAGRRYIPLQMQTDVTRKSWDTYENQVIVNLLDTVAKDADRVRRQVDEFLADDTAVAAQGAPPGEAQSRRQDAVPGGPVRVTPPVLRLARTGVLRGLTDRLDAARDSLRGLQARYAALFGLVPRALASLPEQTRSFQEIKPYAQVFGLAVRWFRYGEFTLDEESMLLRMWTADRLFEYYCLIQLLLLLKDKGYEADGVQPSGVFPYSVPWLPEDSARIANTYHLRKGDVRATLYYEPVVSAIRFENGLRLYRASMPDNTYGAHDLDARAFYRPDFVLQFEGADGEERHVILDAKFAAGNSIRQHHLPHVLSKYVLDISAETPRKAADMVWVLQGRVDPHASEPLWECQNSPLARSSAYGAATGIGISQLGSSPEAGALLWEKIRDRIHWI